MYRFHTQAGFNVVELMVVLLVAGILLSVGVPAFNGFMANGRVAVAANDVISTLHIARTEAIKRRANVTVCPSNDWDAAVPSCDDDFSAGWVVFVDSVPPAVPDRAAANADAVLYARGPMGNGVQLAVADTNGVLAGDPFLVFAPNGYPFAALAGNPAAFNFQLCDDRGDANTGGGIAAGRWIQVSPTGRPQMYREQAQVQAAANPTGGC